MNGFSLNGLSCGCFVGDYFNGVCVEVSGCASVYVDTNGVQTCLACDTTTYEEIPVNGVCVCLVGQLVNGVCCDIEGCIVPMMQNDGTMSCLFCNISLGYTGAPTND